MVTWPLVVMTESPQPASPGDEVHGRRSGGPADAGQVALARDSFDALVALGMLERQEGRYMNTPETDVFLDRNKSSYIGDLLAMSNSRLYRYWGNLTEGLRTGEPQNEIKTRGKTRRIRAVPQPPYT